MPIAASYFFPDIVKKVTASFGYIFSELKVVRDIKGQPKKIINVPLIYANKEKWYTIIKNPSSIQEENPDLYKTIIRMESPILSYYLTNIEPDTTRLLNQSNTIKCMGADSKVKYVNNRIPVIFNFDVRMKATRNNDLFQLIEQILPFFTPSFSFYINDLDFLQNKTEYKVTWEGMDKVDEFEGVYDETSRELTRNLSFKVYGYLYGPTYEGKTIKHMDVIMSDEEANTFLEKITIDVEPKEAEKYDEHEIITKITIDEL